MKSWLYKLRVDCTGCRMVGYTWQEEKYPFRSNERRGSRQTDQALGNSTLAFQTGGSCREDFFPSLPLETPKTLSKKLFVETSEVKLSTPKLLDKLVFKVDWIIPHRFFSEGKIQSQKHLFNGWFYKEIYIPGYLVKVLKGIFHR